MLAAVSLCCSGRSLGIALNITLIAGGANSLASGTLVVLLYPLCFALLLVWLALVFAGAAAASVTSTWLAGPEACAAAVGADLLSLYARPVHHAPCGALGSIVVGFLMAAAAPWAWEFAGSLLRGSSWERSATHQHQE